MLLFVYVSIVCLLFIVSEFLLLIIATRDGFTIAYTTNTTNPNCENGSVVVIVDFMCYPDAVWSSSQLDVSNYLLFFLAVPTDTCLVRTLLYLVFTTQPYLLLLQYTAAFKYSGACIQPVPVEPAICNLVHYNGTALKRLYNYELVISFSFLWFIFSLASQMDG